MTVSDSITTITASSTSRAGASASLSHRKVSAAATTSSAPLATGPSAGHRQAQRPHRIGRPGGRGAASGTARSAGGAATLWRQISAPPAPASSTGHTTPSLNQIPHSRSSSSTLNSSSALPGHHQPRLAAPGQPRHDAGCSPSSGISAHASR